ncbi:MAG TPA: NUDIX domain-containing protein, partial [bacterium]|nr:NUDIX domain-containing protein [bacterium]
MSGRAPRKSAVVVPLTRHGGELRVLVGRRHPRSRFLGGFFAFPGGAHEPEDGDFVADEDGALRRTAARELEEETGLHVEPGALRPAGRRVTPPFGPRRFDSLMYVSTHARAEEPSPQDPGELLDLHWTSPAAIVERWRALEIRIAPPLIPMLLSLAEGHAPDDAALAARLHEVNADMEADGPRIEFVPHVLTILLETPTLPPATHTNCYLAGAQGFLIIDPGSGDPAEIARVVRHARRRADESGGSAVAVVLTHPHGDH